MIVLSKTAMADSLQWEPVVLPFTASENYNWYDFPLQVTFTHTESGSDIILDGYWDGGDDSKSWKVRFSPPKSGDWNWKSSSSDSELDNREGTISVTQPNDSELENNPNLRGHLKTSSDNRRLEYADGTPFFWIGDTNWAITFHRCGVAANNGDGIDDIYEPEYGNNNFFTYVDNRKDKKFNLIQIQFFQRNYYNEGGYAFPENTGENPGNGNWAQINPYYFRYVDKRLDYLFKQGFVVAGHPTWLSKTRISLTWAKLIMKYLMARYGAYNTVWSLSGEYQFSRDDSDSLSPPDEWNQLGEYVHKINYYNHQVTIHPTYGEPSRFDDYSSSGEFHNSSWLGINWIQTFSHVEDVSESVNEDYKKNPVKPVIMAEPGYEFYQSRDQRYSEIDGNLSRLQAWSSILCGAAGHTYGAWGVWQFYTSEHEQSGYNKKHEQHIDHWENRIDAEGASHMQHLKTFFLSPDFDWTALEPHREWLEVNGSEPDWPGQDDFTPPHMAADNGKTYVVYIPSGNSENTITITNLNNNTAYQASWYNPQNGQYTYNIDDEPKGVDQWDLPSLPDNGDWILLLSAEEDNSEENCHDDSKTDD
jgi:hypothetical protein